MTTAVVIAMVSAGFVACGLVARWLTRNLSPDELRTTYWRWTRESTLRSWLGPAATTFALASAALLLLLLVDAS